MRKRSDIFRTTLVITGGILLSTSPSTAKEAAVKKETKEPILYSQNSCARAESWSFTDSISKDWQNRFKKFIQGRTSPAKGFSEALGFRRLVDTAEKKLFSEYWISRSLLRANLYHIAHNGFTSIASRNAPKAAVGIQTAALDCLLGIQKRYPTIEISESVYQNLPQLLQNASHPAIRYVVWKGLHSQVRDQVATGTKNHEILATLKLLEGSGSFSEHAHALYYVSKSKTADSIRHFEKFLFEKNSIPAPLEPYRDTSRLLLARAYYSRGEFDHSIAQLKRIRKNSNELSQALSELAWSYLMNHQLRETIGTAINLQSGGLRRTFSPEGPMVMAMALNELCRYPEAIQAINIFKQRYKPSFVWLKSWKNNKKEQGSTHLYEEAIRFLKNQSKTPVPVATEWLRTPLFIARQDEINLLFDETGYSKKLAKAAAYEQKRMARALLKFAREFKKEYQLAKIKLKPGEDLPYRIIKKLNLLRDQVADYRRFRTAAPVWRTILAQHDRQVPIIKKNLVQKIGRDIRLMNNRMYKMLKQVAENNYFIEVEIYNGASKDIVWKNAHPQYAKVAQELKNEDEETKAERVWNWGHVTTDFDGTAEIWEDELGSFKADIYDNCTSKDRYLALIKENKKGKDRIKTRE